MSFRINTNTQAAQSLSALNKTSNEIGMRQLRLSTGSKINSAADDSAGYTISNKLTAKTRGQAQALSNIGDAKSMLSVAEGSLGTAMDILQTIKEKAIQAGNSSMGADERTALQSQVDELSKEVNDILSGAEFNGTKLFSDDAETNLSFQVGDEAGDTFGASMAKLGINTLGLGSLATEAVEAVEGVEAVEAVTAVTASASVSDDGNTVQAFEGQLTLGGTYTGGADADLTFSVVDNAGTLELQDADGNAVTFDSGDLASGGSFTVDGISVAIGAGYTPAADESFTISAVAAVSSPASSSVSSVTDAGGLDTLDATDFTLGGTFTGAADASYAFTVADNAGTLEIHDADDNVVTLDSGDTAAGGQFTIDGITVGFSGDIEAGDAFTISGVADASTAASASVTDDGDTDAFASQLTVGGTYTGAADASYAFTVADNAGTLELQDADGNAVTFDSGDLASGGSFTVDGISVAIGAGYTPAAGESFTIDAVAAVEGVEGVEGVEAVEAVAVGDFVSALDLSTDEGSAAVISTIDSAIKTVNSAAQGLGNSQNRLDFKSQNLEISMNNYEAANSRIADADFAKEQMEIVKLQILQQTGSAMFAQSNAAPQSVLSFF